jgi:hypothetical protein
MLDNRVDTSSPCHQRIVAVKQKYKIIAVTIAHVMTVNEEGMQDCDYR